ncbi:MAG: hypothetical protein EPO09_21505 [Aquabacterium sp.]|uniref:hypothetical protein n=1 Tax=Aquabacterium sp. TaxID=1872578 RepID=UPI00121F1E97|nr:hypothetical protein [Aquabacterium sp.]TAK82663.1 MAG: hypothetical protein EPO09_21505 [Aquabacterium sp.]
MAKRKNFVAPESVAIGPTTERPESDKALLEVGEGVMHHGNLIDQEEWLGKGVDEWVWLGINQLRVFLAGRTKSVESIITYGRQGWPIFLKFATSTTPILSPHSIAPKHIQQLIDWIKANSAWETKTRSNHYASIKTVIFGMIDRGSIRLAKSDFPINPFTENEVCGEIKTQAHTHLSGSERASLVHAIKQDLIAIHKKKFTGNDIDELTVYLLGIAIRTGTNSTPLLELERDALGPHPFIPNQRLLRTTKRRNGAIQQSAIRQTKTHETPITFPMDGIAIFEMALKKTSYLSDRAPHPEKNRVWIHITPSKDDSHKVTTLNIKELSKGIKTLIDRHDLKGDDGMRLRLNLSRIRKTVENRYWALSGGDMFSVAQLMGHTKYVSDRHYLQLTNEMRQNATIVAEDIHIAYRKNKYAENKDLEQTPTGQCKDSLFGEKAPGDGNTHCIDFMSCFNCRSYAITGSPDDLHRLFSFYWFIGDERERTNSEAWREHYLSLQVRIDKFTQKHFRLGSVSVQKERARFHRHPFWKTYGELSK